MITNFTANFVVNKKTCCCLSSLACLLWSVQLVAGYSERIFEVVLNDGTVISENLIGYEITDGWLLPLGEMSDLLGFAIKVSPALREAEGFILDESKRFKLVVESCSVEILKPLKVLERIESGDRGCKGILVTDEDIFVNDRLFARWFPVDVDVDPFQSRIVINPREKIPVQLRQEREWQAERAKALRKGRGQGFPLQPDEPSFLDGFFLDQQVLIARQRYAGENFNNIETNSTLSAELLGMDGQGYAYFKNNGTGLFRLTLAARDPDAGLFGILHATELELLDINVPRLPMVSNGRLGRGVVLSSYPLHIPEEFGVRDFQGNVPPGWEVEIYQNNILIDRQVAGDNGRYSFKQVPLYYGTNNFKLVYFGPQGQRKEEYSSVRVDPELIAPGPVRYRVVLDAKGSSPSYLLQLEKNLFRTVSVTGAYSQLYLPDKFVSGNLHGNLFGKYGYAGMSGFVDNVLLGGSLVASSGGGKALQLKSQFPLAGASAGLRYTRLFGFSSEIFNLRNNQLQRDEFYGDLAFVFPLGLSIGTTWSVAKKDYEDGNFQNVYMNRLSTNTGRIYWSNELSYITESAVPGGNYAGKLDMSWFGGLGRFRLGTGYNLKSIETIEGEHQIRFFSNYSSSIMVSHQLSSTITQASANFSRLFRGCNLGTFFTLDSSRDYTAGAMLNFSLARDSNSSQWHARAEPQAAYGAASVEVFVDMDRSGTRDHGEKPIKGAQVVLSQSDEPVTSDENGFAFIPRLQGYAPVDLSLAVQSVDDPMLRPAKKGVRFFPRPGKTTAVLFPVVTVGEIDGVVEAVERGSVRAQKGVPVELVDLGGAVIGRTRTDRDGVFYFEEVPPGQYIVRPVAAELKGFIPKPAGRKVSIAAEGGIESGMNFLLGG
ncbi:MAG: carboxypeptidase-like regulatory domain-containing protein [Bdellovibrionota bacterium]|mgnify:CR=1 FL=1